jgi:hypothetical protein
MVSVLSINPPILTSTKGSILPNVSALTLKSALIYVILIVFPIDFETLVENVIVPFESPYLFCSLTVVLGLTSDKNTYPTPIISSFISFLSYAIKLILVSLDSAYSFMVS